MATFRDRFNILFEESKLTQEEFGKLFNATKAQVFNWRNGRGEPDTEMVKLIARSQHVSLSWLLGESDFRTEKISTIAASRSDGRSDDLPEHALREIEQFKEFVRSKYKKQQ